MRRAALAIVFMGLLIAGCGSSNQNSHPARQHPKISQQQPQHPQQPQPQQPQQPSATLTEPISPFGVISLAATGSDSAVVLAEPETPTASDWSLSPQFVDNSGYLSVLRTTDGGSNWTDVTPPDPFSGAPDEWGTALYFLNQDTGWLAVETGKGPTFTITVERTTDGGSSWQASTLTVPFPGGLDLDFTGPQDGWLLAMSTPAAGLMSKVVYTTSDGGRTWQEMSCSADSGCPEKNGGLPGDSYPTGISFLGSDGFVSAFYHGDPYLWFYGSQDAGHTWQRIPLAVPKADAQGWGDVYPPSFFGTSGRMFVQFTNPTGPALVVYQSSDGGRTWQPNASPALPISLEYSAQFGWTSGEDGYVASGDGKELYRTIDGGQTWTRSALPSAAAYGASKGRLQLRFANGEDGFLAACGSTGPCSLFITHDGGKTWTSVAGRVASAN